jgi:hypothetical protein
LKSLPCEEYHGKLGRQDETVELLHHDKYPEDGQDRQSA